MHSLLSKSETGLGYCTAAAEAAEQYESNAFVLHAAAARLLVFLRRLRSERNVGSAQANRSALLDHGSQRKSPYARQPLDELA